MHSETDASLPFAHAIGGCDTTSHLFGIDKGVPLRQLKNDHNFRKQAYVYSGEATKEEIHHAGEAALACLYGGQPDEGLDKLRHRKFCEKVSTSIAPVQYTLCHLHQQLLRITVPECTTRCKSGWAVVHWTHSNADGLWKRADKTPQQRTYLLHRSLC